YPLPRCHFYRRCALPSDAFSIVFFVRRLGRSQVKKIVHRMPEILFAAQIPFGGILSLAAIPFLQALCPSLGRIQYCFLRPTARPFSGQKDRSPDARDFVCSPDTVWRHSIPCRDTISTGVVPFPRTHSVLFSSSDGSA